MPRWLETAFTLGIFSAVMAVIGVGVRVVAPDVHALLMANIGHVGLWGFFIALWVQSRATGTSWLSPRSR